MSSSAMRYDSKRDTVIVLNHSRVTTSQIENFIREKKANRLNLGDIQHTGTLPCVTFIARLAVCVVGYNAVTMLAKAISSMILLETISVEVRFCRELRGENCLSDAIAAHPSLRKIITDDPCGHGIDTVMKRNPRITDYHLSLDTEYSYMYGEVLVKLTGLRTLVQRGYSSTFQDGDFAKFTERNPRINKIMITVQRSTEIVSAISNLTAINDLHIICKICDNIEELERAIEKVRARCYPERVQIYLHHGSYSCIKYRGYHGIYRKKLPKWNFLGTRTPPDTTVHTVELSCQRS